MKVEKSIGIKIIKMSNMDDIVGEMYEATDDNQVHMLLGKDVMQVNVMPLNKGNIFDERNPMDSICSRR